MAQWFINGLAIGTSNHVTFNAPPFSGTYTVSAVGQNGCQRDVIFNVLTPSGVNLHKIGEIHIQGAAQAGFCAAVELLPTSVSFVGVFIREGEDYANGTGSFAHADFLFHPTGRWRVVGANSIFYYDRVSTVAFQNYAGDYIAGEFVWNIPLHYFVGNGPTGQEIFAQYGTAVHRATVDSNGRVKTMKEGASSEFDVDEDTVNCP